MATTVAHRTSATRAPMSAAKYDAGMTPALDDTAERRLLVQVLVAGAVVAVLLGVITALLLRNTARSEAERFARRSTEVAARGIVEPSLEPGLLAGDRAALDRFDDIVRSRILDDTTVRVKVWSGDGTIVYADQRELVGDTFDIEEEEREVLRDGGTKSEISSLDKPENAADRKFDRLLEVYTRVRAPDGSALMYETYVRDAAVSRTGRALWSRMLPSVIGALLLLELVQVPLVILLARRVASRRRERERLLQAAVDASDLERRRIARDLHDGVVQHLAGVGMHLHAAALESGRPASPDARTMAAAAGDVRQAIRELRTLLVHIYPPNLREVGIERALADLVSELPARGIVPELDVALDRPLDHRTEALLYRVAQESVRNAERHARASHLVVRLAGVEDRVSLSITDDGVGYDTTTPAAEGHVGLVLQRDLVQSAGGELHVESAPGRGTTVRVELEGARDHG